MKRFCIYLLLFATPIVCLLGVAESILRKSINDYNVKANYLNDNAKDIECIVLGSSHTMNGIDPSVFSYNTYNVAEYSQTIDLDYYILHKYEKELDSLKYIILPISTFSLGGRLSAGSESWKMKYYVFYYDVPVSNPLKYWELLPMNTHTWKRLAKTILHYPPTLTSDSLGQDKRSYTVDTAVLIADAPIAAKRHTGKPIRYHNVPKTINFIDSIIAIADRHQAKVIILNPPATIYYREAANAEHVNLMLHVSDSIATTHTNVFHANYYADERFIEQDFFNSDHLNEQGAKKLSTLLANDLDSLGIIR